ncbi:DUF3336 domain-containing protein [Pseudomaricurvus alcaniphilus]|uniref:DUF3336 domain-containing protein n=1 Tax=Pseudomaricurvus alcaniphilus TaxID=1166482 RepID=UPI00140B88A4|nr:DUF3336 domain-containing protein [Pseudomaricurvus alcaniphilus]NHN38999.1 DUF3336 domain-containing protein [Pseudomaricurvus alcaniphilus]
MILKFKRQADSAMKGAINYQQWAYHAKEYDRRYGLDEWKKLNRTSLYNYIATSARLKKLRELRRQGNDRELLFYLNEGIHGNLDGMGGAALYGKAKFGTKNLIRDYNEEVAAALQYLAGDSVTSIALEEKREFFLRVSHCYGRSALLLSGAGTLLYFHFGVVKTLWEQGLLPKVVSGASGGAVTAALLGTHTSEELGNIFDPDYLKLEIEREVGLFNKFLSFRNEQVSGEEMRNHIDRLIPDLTFQEAYKLTGIHINISITPSDPQQRSRLLNAITSPNALIREAVQASCAAPGFVAPVTLAARNSDGSKVPYLKNQQWVDGSVSNDLPMSRLSRLYGVNHFIVSQTNPLVLPFVDDRPEQHGYGSILKNLCLKSTKELSLASGKTIAKVFRRSAGVKKIMNMYTSVLSQNYTGDITILPTARLHNPLTVLAGKTRGEIMELFKEGEKSTWPHIERVRIQTAVSRMLDTLVHDFDEELLGYASQVAAPAKNAVH